MEMSRSGPTACPHFFMRHPRRSEIGGSRRCDVPTALPIYAQGYFYPGGWSIAPSCHIEQRRVASRMWKAVTVRFELANVQAKNYRAPLRGGAVGQRASILARIRSACEMASEIAASRAGDGRPSHT